MAALDAPTTEQARQLTDRIKVAVEGTWLLIQEAYTSRAWAVLGYDTWDAYCAAEFGNTRLRLPREERQEVVASLRESGLSIRAISSATGAAYNTVLRDVTQIESPTEITGADGKTYAASRPAPEPRLADDADWVEPDDELIERSSLGAPHVKAVIEQGRAKRRPLPEAFADAGRDLTRAAEKLTRLADDDRFTRNRDATHHQVPELLGALEHTTRLVQAMNLADAQASEEARRWWATSLHKISDALADVANSLEQEQ
jgi:transposase-like protein